MVVPNVVPRELVAAVCADVMQLLDASSDDRHSWYNRPPGSVMPSNPSGSYLSMHHGQSIWDCRQHPRMHQLFSELWGTETLWAGFGSINMKPPFDSRHAGERGVMTNSEDVEWEWGAPLRLHWDWQFPAELEAVGTELDGFSLPLRKCYGRPQAVLHLEDTAENQGGSKLLPGFHRLLAYQPSLRTRILDDPELSQRLGRNLLEDEDVLAIPEVRTGH